MSRKPADQIAAVHAGQILDWRSLQTSMRVALPCSFCQDRELLADSRDLTSFHLSGRRMDFTSFLTASGYPC